MSRKYYTSEMKRDLIHQGIELNITLNGKRAVISGALLDFARVRTYDGSLDFEYAWATVDAILTNGGTFKA